MPAVFDDSHCERVESLVDFTRLTVEFTEKTGGAVWYRGAGSSEYKLIPSLYRHNSSTDFAAYYKLEKKLLSEFKDRSPPFLTEKLGSDWEAFFMMQHFGVPTRFLDWTENPFIALYFALIAQANHPDKDAAVWMMSPLMWNSWVFEMAGQGPLSVSNTRMKGYSTTDQEYDYVSRQCAAMYGIHNSRRIVAQRGVFIIFGSNIEPMENVYATESAGRLDSLALTKLIIPKEAAPSLLKSITAMGFTDSVVFPDLEGLAREIKRANNFN